MREQWINLCLGLGLDKSEHFYSGCRKIYRGINWTLEGVGGDLTLEDIGYTNHKMRQLERNYYHRESHEMAITLWERRKSQGRYGSVGFSTFNHLLKGDIEKKSKRASVMGPCIQAVNLTLLKKGVAEVDVFYRTTEILKKFPADLVFLRDVLLAPFDTEFRRINFHFANLTLHPMYWVTLVPLLDKPIRALIDIRGIDPYFHNWVVKWTARYLCEEHGRGIDKFSQACRVRDVALANIQSPERLVKYLRKNHPGFRK